VRSSSPLGCHPHDRGVRLATIRDRAIALLQDVFHELVEIEHRFGQRPFVEFAYILALFKRICKGVLLPLQERDPLLDDAILFPAYHVDELVSTRIERIDEVLHRAPVCDPVSPCDDLGEERIESRIGSELLQRARAQEWILFKAVARKGLKIDARVELRVSDGMGENRFQNAMRRRESKRIARQALDLGAFDYRVDHGPREFAGEKIGVIVAFVYERKLGKEPIRIGFVADGREQGMVKRFQAITLGQIRRLSRHAFMLYIVAP
jgi:hypothetical protein